MRHHLLTLAVAAALTVGGAAQAAPGFGAASHRLGGAAGPAKAQERQPLGWFEAVLGLIGIDLAASVEPVVADTLAETGSRSKECEETKKTEVAKSEKTGRGAGSRGKGTPSEPVYLAF